jgi:hypothetical protein
MARVFWIVGLSITLVMFVGGVIVCVIALVTHRHLNMTGWTILLVGIYAAKFIFERLRSAIKFGDPTKDLGSTSSH